MKKHTKSVYAFFSLDQCRGMTLLEVLIALVITIGIMGSSVSFINRKENQIKKTLRQWTALNRQLDYQARLSGQKWRLVIDLDKNSYWVEKKKPALSPNNTLHLDENAPADDPDNSSAVAPLSPVQSDFVIDKNFFEKPQVLPKKFRFESLELSYQAEPKTQGLAYIYYLPGGQFSTALVLIKYKKSYRSLFFNRLRGEMILFSGQKKLKDLNSL